MMSEQEQKNKGSGCLLIAGTIFFIPALIGLLLVALISDENNCAPRSGGGGELPSDAQVGPFDREQLQNAVIIANTASELGLGERGQFIGIMAAIGESTLRNLGYGDDIHGVTNPDGSATCSVGLFQQQWCLKGQPWGTREDALDPRTASMNFLKALREQGDWETGTPTLVINAVQGNSDPMHYAPYEEDAKQILSYITPHLSGGGGASSGGSSSPVGQCGGGGTVNGTLALPLDPGFIMTDTYGERVAPTPTASSWHPAYDLIIPGQSCGPPVYSISNGVVEVADNSWLSIRNDSGEVISYVHFPSKQLPSQNRRPRASGSANCRDRERRGQRWLSS